MSANSKFYLNKLVYEYNNTYHRSTGKKPVDADYFALTKETEINPKSPKSKVCDRVRITKYKNILAKVAPKNWSNEIFVINSVLKTNTQTYKTKDLNKETIRGSFYKKELLLSKL